MSEPAGGVLEPRKDSPHRHRWYASLSDSSPRAADWRQTLGSLTAPIKGPLPYLMRVPLLGVVLAYEMDVDALTAEQRALTVTNLAERFNVPLEEAWEEFREHGCPVLMENVHVWRCCPEVRMIGGGRRA